MSRLLANMQAELAKASPSVFPLLEIDWPPSATTARYARSDNGVASLTLGPSYAEVMHFGSLTRSIRDRGNALQSWSTTVDLRDQHFAIANVFALYDCMNTPARIKLASANVDPAYWFTVCEGVLTGFEESSPRVWTLTLGPNEAPLRSPLLRQTLTPAVFSTLPTDKYGTPLPLCFGRHDTSGEAGQGKLATIYVGLTGSQSQHVLCLGAASIQRVYADGTKLASSTYTVSYPLQAGLRLTLITFTTDRSAATITVDAFGFGASDTAPDATQAITPGAAIMQLLTQFAWQSWTSGAGFGLGDTPIDVTAFSLLDSALSKRASGVSYVASRFIDSQSTGLEELNSWASSHEVKIFWTSGGLLSCKLDDPSVYTDNATYWLRRDRCRDFLRSWPTDNTSREVDVSYGLSFSNAVQDTRSRSDAVDSIDMAWGPAFE